MELGESPSIPNFILFVFSLIKNSFSAYMISYCRYFFNIKSHIKIGVLRHTDLYDQIIIRRFRFLRGCWFHPRRRQAVPLSTGLRDCALNRCRLS